MHPTGDDPIHPGKGLPDTRRPLGVYVHIPFCHARCPYCDFATTGQDEGLHGQYIDAVMAELAAKRAWFQPEGATLASVYFGGGTPGIVAPHRIGAVLGRILDAFPRHAQPEVTVETNPGDVDADRLRALRDAGVNRVSFGAQAFQDRLLAAIGRHHRAHHIRAAFESARQAGIDNVCADLMFGLPGQSHDDWEDSMNQLVALAPGHITTYALTVEPGTPFGVLDRKGQLPRPDDTEVAAMYSRCHERMAAAGYEHYEISSYAKPGRRSRHNTLYWQGGAYLGLGASAASFRPLADGTGIRFTNPRSTQTYLRAAGKGQFDPAQVEIRNREQCEDEAVWLALRTRDGLDRAAHRERHGEDALSPPGRTQAAQSCVAAGWLEITPEFLRLTPAGFLFADEVAVRLSRMA